MDTRDLVITLLIGLVAGWLASFVVGGSGIIRYLITGLIGSVVGLFLFRTLGIQLGIANPIVAHIVVSAIGAMVVVLIARMIA